MQNPALQAQRIQVEVEKSDVIDTEKYSNPELEFVADGVVFDSERGSFINRLQPSFIFRQEIFTSGKREKRTRVEAADADTQTGWYIEPSYRLNRNIGFYTRYEEVDAARDRDNFNQWELGLNWWPSENVVIKFDYRDRSHDLLSENGRDFSGIDLGVGYSF